MKKFSVFLILIFSLSQPVQAASNPMGDMMSAMLRMMTAMANHMAGSFGGSSSINAGSNFGSGFNPWMSGMPGMWPGSSMTPWSTMPYGGIPSGAGPGFGIPPNPRWQQGPPGPYPNRATTARSPLEGNWLSQSGEALQVRNNHFRLRSREGVLSGTLRLENNNHLKLFVPRARLVIPYRYARKRGALMLQHTSGQVLYFKQQPPSRY